MAPNPYLNRSMIRSLDEFYGRAQPLERLFACIGASTPQSVSIVGERRVGKSSLLWHVSQAYDRHLERPTDFVVSMLDFQGQQHLDPAGFCRVFAEQLKAAAPASVALPPVDDLSGLQRAVDALAAAGLRLVCLFDEFETVTRNPAFGAEFYGFLRSLANTRPVAFVTASHRPLETLCHNQQIAESPFFNIFTQIHLGPMSDAEIQHLIAVPSQAAGRPLAAYADAVTDLGGYLPFYVQIACSAAFDALGDDDGDGLDKQAVSRRFAQETNSHFRYVWERFDENKRKLVAALACSKGIEAQEALDELIDDGYVIDDDGKYRLFSSAFARFVQRHGGLAVPVQDSTSATKASSPSRRRMPLLLAGVFVLLAALTLGWYLLQTVEVAEVAAEGLQLNLLIPGAAQPLPLKAFWSAADHPEVLRAADRLRLQVQSGEPGYLYACRLDFDGAVTHLPDAADPTPIRLETRQSLALPVDPADSFVLDPSRPPSVLYLVFTTERDHELEELYQRLPLAPAALKPDFRRRLVGRIAKRASARVELPLASTATAGY